MNSRAVIQRKSGQNAFLQKHLFEGWTPFDFTVEMGAATSFDESHAVHHLQFVGK